MYFPKHLIVCSCITWKPAAKGLGNKWLEINETFAALTEILGEEDRPEIREGNIS